MLDEDWGMCVEVARGTRMDPYVVKTGMIEDMVQTVYGSNSEGNRDARQRGQTLLN